MGTKNNSPNPTPKRNKFENINIAQPMSNATWTPRGPIFFFWGRVGVVLDYLIFYYHSQCLPPKCFE